MRATSARPWIVLLATLLLGFGGGAALAGTIEPELRGRLDAGFTSDFVVRFSDQADLSAAYEMSWPDRGEFVYGVLREVAGQSQATVRAILDARGASYHSFLAGNEIYVRRGDASLAAAIAARSEVAVIRAPIELRVDDLYVAPVGGENSVPSLSWGVVDSGAPMFWSLFSTQGAGIVVAEMSTGVQWDHPALDGAFQCGADPTDPRCWFDPSNICGGSACDNNGLGTHLTGIMVGDNDPALTYQAGMAPDAHWIACKACESSSCSAFAITSCADWMLAPDGNPNNRPHVVLVPWGRAGCDDWFQPQVAAWRAAGIFPAIRGGSAGPNCSSLSSPGDYQESFAAATHDSDRVVASFSSRGPSCFGHEPFTKPNLSAPGVSICSSVPTNSWSCGYSGSGLSAAHAAGAAALLWSCAPVLIGQIDASFMALQDGAASAPVGNCGAPPDGEGDYTHGYGFLDVVAAAAPYCSSMPFQDGFETGDTTAWTATVP